MEFYTQFYKFCLNLFVLFVLLLVFDTVSKIGIKVSEANKSKYFKWFV